MDVPNFETFCADPQLINEPISKAWITFYKVIEGEPLDEEGEALYRASTGRDRYERRVYTEATGVCGRRSEKTQSALKFLIYKALFAGWEKHLGSSWFSRIARHSRVLHVPIIAQDMRVGRTIQRTVESLVLSSPVLSKEVSEIATTQLTFKNGVAIACFPASKASVRSLACPAGLLDELAFVSVEGADDRELVRQVKPSMIQFGGARRLIKLSTPWRKAGVLYQEFSERLTRLEPLVWQASTATMTPRIAAADLERERAADASYYAREFEAQFTDDLEQFIPEPDIVAAVADWVELPPDGESYNVAALDASGLTGGDVFSFGIASAGKVRLLRGWRRAAVGAVCDEIASLCRLYGIQKIICDQFAFTFLAELMRQRGVELAQQPFSARSKPEIYFSLKNMLAQGKLRLPNHPETIRELRALESVRTSGGAYRIGAPRGLHDDYVTILALLAHKLEHSESNAPVCFYMDVRATGSDDMNDPFNDFGFGPRRGERVPSFGRSRN